MDPRISYTKGSSGSKIKNLQMDWQWFCVAHGEGSGLTAACCSKTAGMRGRRKETEMDFSQWKELCPIRLDVQTFLTRIQNKAATVGRSHADGLVLRTQQDRKSVV